MDVLFDLDDTLHDKSTSLTNYASHIWEQDIHNLCQSKSEFISWFMTENTIPQPKTEAFQKLAFRFGFPQDYAEQLLHEFDNAFHKFAQPFDGALATLAKVKNYGGRIGCITNGRDFFQRNKIKALGLMPYFDFVITSESLGIRKPDKRIFQKGLDLFGAPPSSEVCFCGDNLEADIKPAKEIGLITLWKSSSNSRYADYTFESFTEFDVIWENLLKIKASQSR